MSVARTQARRLFFGIVTVPLQLQLWPKPFKMMAWMMASLVGSLLVTSAVGAFLVNNKTDLLLLHVFLQSTLYSLLGSFWGGVVGIQFESGATCCDSQAVIQFEMPTMGSFLGATIGALIGGSLPALVYFAPQRPSEVVLVAVWVFSAFCFLRLVARPQRQSWKVDPQDKHLIAWGVLIGASAALQVLLAIVMFGLMKRDFSNTFMLGSMMYGMGGAMLGGMLGGWVSGFSPLSTPQGAYALPKVSRSMTLMGGMMGGMLAGMTSSMLAPMGYGGALAALLSGLGLLLAWVILFWFQYAHKQKEKINETC